LIDKRWCVRLLALGLVLAISGFAHMTSPQETSAWMTFAHEIPAQADADATVTVVSRNIYLGADVGSALELLPDMPAAAQLMWEQVTATDFSRRAPLLAADAPDVVAIQEATTWECRPTLFGSSTVVFDILEQLLGATQDTGVEYALASAGDRTAMNPGYSIPVLPYLTTVRDPQTFQPLFGTDSAACGFTIGDALLVRADRADDVRDVGQGDYSTIYSIVPVLFEIDRGYVWIDLAVGSGEVRFVTTHLESLWSEGATPVNALQAQELVEVVDGWGLPLVVMGDFNSDPRDPRPLTAPNPGLQPDTTTECQAQVESPSHMTARAECSPYWTMVRAGFRDAGPDALDPMNATWGSSALLAGPDPDRLAQAPNNPYGYTDRLDYVFTSSGIEVVESSLVSATWPTPKGLWECTDAQQVENANLAATIMGVELPRAFCLPTDHVGVRATLKSGEPAVAPQADDRPPVLFWLVILGLIAALSGAISWWAIRRSSLER
jgi:endonuclease/exonuclease/phosphatase family metal-dependent hydrolase